MPLDLLEQNATRTQFLLECDARGTCSMPDWVYASIAELLPERLLLSEEEEGLRCTLALQTRAVDLISSICRKAGLTPKISCHARYPDPISDVAHELMLLSATTAKMSQFRKLRAGQLIVADELQQLDMAATVARHCPELPLVYPVLTPDRIEKVAAALEERLGEPVQRAFGVDPLRQQRLVVATSLAAQSINLVPYAMIFLLEDPLIQLRVRRLMTETECDRMFVVRRADIALSDDDEAELHARIGPKFQVGLLPQQPRLTVHTVHFGGTLPENDDLPEDSPPDPDRMYGRHRARNGLIAELAWQLCRHHSASTPAHPTIVVLASSVSQAQALRSMLKFRRSTLLAKVREEVRLPEVLTVEEASRKSSCPADWLIYAAGGPPSEWLAGLYQRKPEVPRPARIVDLTDLFDPAAARLAHARGQCYVNDLKGQPRRIPQQVLHAAWRAAEGRSPSRVAKPTSTY